MQYSNHDHGLPLQDAAVQSSPQKFPGLARGTRSIRRRVREAATMTRRKLAPCGLPAAAALVLEQF